MDLILSRALSVLLLSVLLLLNACGDGTSPANVISEQSNSPIASAEPEEQPEIGAANIQPVESGAQQENSQDEVPLETNLEAAANESETTQWSNAHIASRAEDFGPFNDAPAKASHAFAGSDDEQFLTEDSVGELLNIALFGVTQNWQDIPSLTSYKPASIDSWVVLEWPSLVTPWPFEFKSFAIKVPNAGEKACSSQYNSGTLNVEAELLQETDAHITRLFTLNYDNCVNTDDHFFNGTVKVQITRNLLSESVSDRFINHFVSYEDLTIKRGGQELKLNGAIKWHDPNSCADAGERTYFLNVENITTRKTILLENFKTQFVSSIDGVCSLMQHKTNNVSGHIIHSDYGRVTLDTPKSLQYPLELLYEATMKLNPDAGLVELSAKSSKASFSLGNMEYIQADIPAIYPEEKIAKLVLESELMDTPTTHIQHSDMFLRGGMLSLSDNDQDGLPNSWEQVNGLDSSNPTDSASDASGDSAKSRFDQLGTVIDNSNFNSQTLDRRASLWVSTGNADQAAITVRADTYAYPNHEYLDIPHEISVTASKAGVWTFDETICTENISEFSVTCLRDAQNQDSIELQYLPDLDGGIAFHADAGAPDFDPNQLNNVIDSSYVFNRRIDDVAFKELPVDAELDFRVGEEYSSSAILHVPVTKLGARAVLELTADPQIEFTSVIMQYDGSDYEIVCEIGEKIVCPSRYISADSAITVYVLYRVSEAGSYSINWNILQGEFESNIENNSITSTVTATPVIYDFSIRTQELDGAVSELSNGVHTLTAGIRQESQYDPEDMTVTVDYPEQAQIQSAWVENLTTQEQFACLIGVQVVCRDVAIGSSSDYEARIEYTVSALDAYTFNWLLSGPVDEGDIENNTASSTVTAEPLVYDFSISGQAYRGAVAESSDGMHTVTATIKQLSDNGAANMVVMADYPEQITVRTAYVENLTTQDQYFCTLGSKLICNDVLISPNADYEITVDYSVSAADSYTFNWSVSGDVIEDVTDNNVSTSDVVIMNDMVVIQELVDNAQDGDTVVLPAGEYMGYLYLGYKGLTLVGAAGPESTTLYSTSIHGAIINSMGRNTTISGLTFKITGSAIMYETGNYLTVVNNRFEPLPYHLSDPEGINNTHGIFFSSVGTLAVELKFVNNEVLGFGVKEQSNCSNLMPITAWELLYIEGNTFHDIDCNYGIFEGTAYWYTGGSNSTTTYINNNTIHNVSSLMWSRFYDGEFFPQVTTITNNIMSNVAEFFDADTEYTYGISGNSIVTANNIVFESERDSVLSASMLGNGSGIVEQQDINTDPLFINAAQEDFNLSPLSPAIDMAISASYTTDHFRYVVDALVVDGLLDGQEVRDIGALEFLP